jgi:hypothetical protein
MTGTPYVRFTPAKASSAKKNNPPAVRWVPSSPPLSPRPPVPHRPPVNLPQDLVVPHILRKNMQTNIPLQINNNNYYFRAPNFPSYPPAPPIYPPAPPIYPPAPPIYPPAPPIYPPAVASAPLAPAAPAAPNIPTAKKQKKTSYLFWLIIAAVFLLFILCLFFFKK